MFLFKTEPKKEKQITTNDKWRYKLSKFSNINKNKKIMDKISKYEKLQEIINKLDMETLKTFNENIDTFERFINSYLFKKEEIKLKTGTDNQTSTDISSISYNDLLGNIIKIANKIKIKDSDPQLFIENLIKFIFSPKFEDKKEKLIFIKNETMILQKLKEMKSNKEIRIKLVKSFIEYLIRNGYFNGENSITFEDNNELLFYFLISGLDYKNINIKLLIQFFKFEYFIAEPFYSVISPNSNIKSSIIKDKFRKDYEYRYSKDRNLQNNYFKLLLHLDYDFNILFYQYENNNKKYVYIKLEPNPILNIESFYNIYSVNKYEILQIKKNISYYDKYKTIEYLLVDNNIKKLLLFIKDTHFKINDIDTNNLNVKVLLEYIKNLFKNSEENSNGKFIDFLSEILAKADESYETVINNYNKNIVPIQERISDVEYHLKELKQKHEYYNYFEKTFKYLNQEKGNLEGLNLKNKIQQTDNIYLSQKFVEPKLLLSDKINNDIKKYVDEDITSSLLEELLNNYNKSDVIMEQTTLKILGNFKNYEFGKGGGGKKRKLKKYKNKIIVK